MPSIAEAPFQRIRCRFLADPVVETLVYVRPYRLGQDGEDTRTLSVVGLPVLNHPIETVLEGLFSACGPVERVAVHPGQTTAMVVFKTESGCERALRTATELETLQLQLPPPDRPFGLRGWVEEHKAKFPGNAVLKEKLDKWTEGYEQEEALRKAAAAKAAEDDGWTVVKRKGGRKKNQGGGISVGAVAPAAAEAQARAAAEKQQKDLNFYSFARRERQLDSLVQLRKKFAEDAQRVKELRASRRFKPY